MNHPAGQAGAPAKYLKIQGDPTWWGLAAAPPQDGWSGNSATIPIITPVTGTLILSPARVGSYSLTLRPLTNGWEHGAEPIVTQSPHLYIPTTSGLTPHSHGYPLATHYDLPTFQLSVIDVMNRGVPLAVDVDADGNDVVVLNGAQLPFLVLTGVATS